MTKRRPQRMVDGVLHLKCRRCRRFKSELEFYENRTHGGRASCCKRCANRNVKEGRIAERKAWSVEIEKPVKPLNMKIKIARCIKKPVVLAPPEHESFYELTLKELALL